MDKLELRTADLSKGLRALYVTGPVTLGTLFELQDAVRKEQGSGLIISLAAVPYMDSAGLGAILGAYASCQRHERRFALANVSQRVLTLFQVAKVDGLIPRYDTVEAAASALAVNGRP